MSTQSKADIIEQRRSNLPLPEDPPTTSDFNSSDKSTTTGMGSGSVSSGFSTGNDSLRGPSSGDSGVRTDPKSASGPTVDLANVGRQSGGGLPDDAVARGSKDHKGLESTTGKDYGYPHKNDPSNGDVNATRNG